MKFLEELAARKRFGMKPGLDAIRGVCAALGNPQDGLRGVIHVAGTNGKGAVCAILDGALRSTGAKVARYTSPHLVKINERFFLNGAPVSDEALDCIAAEVSRLPGLPEDFTFFEALTAVAFKVFAVEDCDWNILETGLGGRLDATNVCKPKLCIITKIGLDHCDWLGETVEKIAAEKAGIIKEGIPIILARNEDSVIDVVRKIAAEKHAPFYYAPDLASDGDIPADFPLAGSFNRENCVTAIAALKVSGVHGFSLSNIVWPGRFQRIGNFIVDGAHNPPAARALAVALSGSREKYRLICGFCGDKDVVETLRILKPFVSEGLAVRTNNPRSLSAERTAEMMNEIGISARSCPSLKEAIRECEVPTLICGSLFLAGEAIVELGAYPWGVPRYDPSEALKEKL